MYIRIKYSDRDDAIIHQFNILDLSFVNNQITFEDEEHVTWFLDCDDFYRFDVFLGKIGDLND